MLEMQRTGAIWVRLELQWYRVALLGQILILLPTAGGAYVGPTQDALLHWAERAGIATYKVHIAGKNIFAVEGKRVVHEGTVPQLDVRTYL
jgi:monoamine oxidase